MQRNTYRLWSSSRECWLKECRQRALVPFERERWAETSPAARGGKRPSEEKIKQAGKLSGTNPVTLLELEMCKHCSLRE